MVVGRKETAHHEELIDQSQMGPVFSQISRPCVEFSERHINVSDILRIVLLFLSVSDILNIVSLLLACVGFERCVAVSAVLYPRIFPVVLRLLPYLSIHVFNSVC